MPRAVSTELDKLLDVQQKVLDHGFIRVVDYMGNDASVVQAARISYGEGTKQISQDKGLINYLMRNYHTTPFEMCEIKLHVKMPMFVARQWVRHRTANINEYSARYSVLSNDFYVPHESQVCRQSKENKQVRADAVEAHTAEKVINDIKQHSEDSYKLYEHLIGSEEKEGIARELARAVLPVNFYTEMYWKIDANNFMHFIRLREHAHAQFEIREYGRVLLDILKAWMPITYEAFLQYRKGCFNVSQELMQHLISKYDSVDEIVQHLKKHSNLTAREIKEFESYIGARNS